MGEIGSGCYEEKVALKYRLFARDLSNPISGFCGFRRFEIEHYEEPGKSPDFTVLVL